MKYLKFSFLSTLIIAFFLSFAAYADMADTINKAGKQRMLTQKMSKEVLLIAAGIDVEANKTNLAATTALFDSTLKGLTDACMDEGIKGQLNVVGGLWETFRPNVTGDTSAAVLGNLAAQNMPLLKAMNAAVQMYEKKGGSLAPEVAATINKAGKQRMLTQKMTKELLLVANGIAVDANKANLAATVSAFDKALNELITAARNGAIDAQLNVVKKLWGQYKPTLDSVDIGKEGLTKAAELNMPLLTEMNKAVGMYAAAAK